MGKHRIIIGNVVYWLDGVVGGEDALPYLAREACNAIMNDVGI